MMESRTRSASSLLFDRANHAYFMTHVYKVSNLKRKPRDQVWNLYFVSSTFTPVLPNQYHISSLCNEYLHEWIFHMKNYCFIKKEKTDSKRYWKLILIFNFMNSDFIIFCISYHLCYKYSLRYVGINDSPK